jgi:hypothetical protein
MKKITFLITLMITSLVFAQQEVIENFEDPTSHKLEGGFGGLKSSIVADPAAGGTNSNVLKLDVKAPPATEIWQGESVNLLKGKRIRVTTDKTVKVDVYSSEAFTLMCKVEGGINGAKNSGASKAYTTPNAWQTLTFTFTEKRDSADDANGDYAKFVFFPNWKVDNTGFKNPPVAFTLYVDNITGVLPPVSTCANGVKDGDETGIDCGGSCTACDVEPTTAAPTPQLQNASGVASIFSNQYSNITINEWPTGWSRGTAVDVKIAGDDTKKLKLNDFVGIDFQSSPINATEMDRWHMDFWVNEPNLLDKNITVKFIDFGGTDKEVAPTKVYLIQDRLTTPVIESGKWVTIDLPIVQTNRGDIKQVVINSSMTGAIYIDNFYLYNSKLGTKSFADLGAKMHPNPTTGIVTIEAKNIIDKVSLHNILGQEILVQSPNAQTTTLDISNLQAGVYVVKTTINGKVASSRVVKK